MTLPTTKSGIAGLAALLLLSSPLAAIGQQAAGPIAGKATIGATVTQFDAVVAGWSAKKAILNKTVYNDQEQRIGKIEDIIIAPENAVSFAIVSTGGFLGVGKHDVAIPVEQIQLDGSKFILPGASKDVLKQLPAFEYARKK